MIAYVRNEILQKEINANNKNCWEIYLDEILHEMGVTFEALPYEKLNDMQILSHYTAILLGAQTGNCLDKEKKDTLHDWVKHGGLLIGFMTSGMDELFGIESREIIEEEEPYNISAYFDLLPHILTRNIHPHIFLEQQLLILSSLREAACTSAVKLGCLYDVCHKDTRNAAITWNQYGKGFTAWFAFDVPKTVWILHQGKPLYDFPQTQVTPRTRDGFVLDNNSGKIPYADEIIYLLTNMLATQGEPFIYTLPPHIGKVPDAAIVWGGDEYFGPASLSLAASDFMRELNLPYHINIESENHPITKEEFQHITVRNKHEISLYILLDENNHITLQRIQQQRDKLMERFGIEPGCCLFNVVRWYGWAEPARWLAEGGGTSIHSKLPNARGLEHPFGNSSAFAMNAGTANPFHYYDDAEHNNAFIPCVEQPPVGYELGHNGSTGVKVEISDDNETHLDIDSSDATRGDDVSQNYDDIHLPVDMAVKYHTLSHFFYHPLYIEGYPNCREAIRRIVKYIDFLDADVYHMANNQAAAWWNERRNAMAQIVSRTNNCVKINVTGGENFGIIVKFPLLQKIKNISVNNADTEYRIIQDFGKEWLHIAIPPGGGICKVEWSVPS
jgi:hypothetical protein